MDIRSSLEGLKSLLGTPAAAPAASQQPRSRRGGGRERAGQRPGDIQQRGERGFADGRRTPGVRMDKVAEIQAALAAGSYNVSGGRRGLQGGGFDAGRPIVIRA